MMNLSLLADIDIHDHEALAPYALYACQLFVTEWSKIDIENFTIKRLTGGQENYTFLCSVTDEENSDFDGPFKLILKIHGDSKRTNFKHMFRDSLITSIMSAIGMGPKVHGIFDLGRVERYIPCLPLTQSEMKSSIYRDQLARKIASFHFLDFPLERKPDSYFNQLKGQLDFIYNYKFEKLNELHEKFIKYNVKYEFDEILKFAQSLKSPIVYSHNDICFANILKLDENDLMIIDYEDSSYNYRGFDIGTYFSSFMFNSCNNDSYPYFNYYPDAFPSEEDQICFVNSYIDEYKIKLKQSDSKNSENILKTLNTEQLLLEGRVFACLFHLCSGIWGKFSDCHTKDKFGFKEWAIKRCEAYFHLKNIYLKDGFNK